MKEILWVMEKAMTLTGNSVITASVGCSTELVDRGFSAAAAVVKCCGNSSYTTLFITDIKIVAKGCDYCHLFP